MLLAGWGVIIEGPNLLDLLLPYRLQEESWWKGLGFPTWLDVLDPFFIFPLTPGPGIAFNSSWCIFGRK